MIGGFACVFCLSFWIAFCQHDNPPFAQPAEDPLINSDGLVVAYHPAAREAGQAVLARGGNAVDAFIATVAAENVLAEGASSLAGSLAALIYLPHAGGFSVYLDADFNDALNADHRVSGRGDKGKAILVPGAPMALHILAEKYGTMRLPELLAPAIALADDGFPVSRLMASFLQYRKRTLDNSEYGRRTFFADGKPLRRGQTLRQSEAAAFLRRFAAEGADYVYKGDWGREFLKTVEAHGGLLTERDLQHYRVHWRSPITATYRGHKLAASSGTAYGGAWALLALKAWEHAGVPADPPYWSDPEHLETMLRIAHHVWSETWLLSASKLTETERIDDSTAAELWQRVQSREAAKPMGAGRGHSYQIITADRNGMVVNGTTTINSSPWGDGIFVQGLPLTAAGSIPWHTKPGQRRLGAFTMHFAFRDGRLRFATGCISNSLVEAAFQTLVKLIDYGMSPREAASTPRFGTFPISGGRLRLDRNTIDPRVGRDIVKLLKKRGLKLVNKGLIETGLGAILAVRDDGTLEGTTMPTPYIGRPFSSEP